MENEDDYLSDKFLAEALPIQQPKTYADRRRQALAHSRSKNDQNRTKSRRQRELQSRAEGLSKSLFEKAAEEEALRGGAANKALAMMMKMGFKPGQSLGRVDDAAGGDSEPSDLGIPTAASDKESSSRANDSSPQKSALQQRIEPLPVNEWAGRKGIGLGKRAVSPSDIERQAKVAKLEDTNTDSFRDRARHEFEQRQAESQLLLAQNTCVDLDEKAGKQFNVLWLNPTNPDSFPEGLLEALEGASFMITSYQDGLEIQERLKSQMRADALQPFLSDLNDEVAKQKAKWKEIPFSTESVDEAAAFLHLSSKARLEQVLDYLRSGYSYCFWCGTRYEDIDEMRQQCPGADEDAHD